MRSGGQINTLLELTWNVFDLVWPHWKNTDMTLSKCLMFMTKHTMIFCTYAIWLLCCCRSLNAHSNSNALHENHRFKPTPKSKSWKSWSSSEVWKLYSGAPAYPPGSQQSICVYKYALFCCCNLSADTAICINLTKMSIQICTRRIPAESDDQDPKCKKLPPRRLPTPRAAEFIVAAYILEN